MFLLPWVVLGVLLVCNAGGSGGGAERNFKRGRDDRHRKRGPGVWTLGCLFQMGSLISRGGASNPSNGDAVVGEKRREFSEGFGARHSETRLRRPCLRLLTSFYVVERNNSAREKKTARATIGEPRRKRAD
jgi:hypothetical protein